MIPVIQIYIREVGLGFGYRYTIASIKAADRENDIKKLVKELKALSRTQADLAKVDRWAVDLEDPGDDPRWTIVLRAMISQGTASPTMLQYNELGEPDVASLFLFDAMIAFRSDLTFYMAVRAWLNTNYHEYDRGGPAVRDNPLFSGFVLLSVRQKRLLAHVSSNPTAFIGDHPPLPGIVKAAIRGVRFSSTFLIQPGLLQMDLGWPNNMGWDLTIGPLSVQCLGGMIFRVSSEDFVIGISYMARGRLEIRAGLDLGLIGVWVEVIAEIAFGTRLIARLKYGGSDKGFEVYSAIGLEFMISIKFTVWIKIPLIFTTIKISFSFEFAIGFTAGLEAAIGSHGVGIRGRGSLFIAVMGHRFQVSANFSLDTGGAVDHALSVVQEILNMGLDASDASTDLPGLGPEHTRELRSLRAASIKRLVARARAVDGQVFHIPGYTVFVIRNPQPDGWSCFTLIPRGEITDAVTGETQGIEQGFLPPPPLAAAATLNNHGKGARRKRSAAVGTPADFELTLPAFASTHLRHYDPLAIDPVTRAIGTWVDCGNTVSWSADWNAMVANSTEYKNGAVTGNRAVTLAQYLVHAYLTVKESETAPVTPVSDPDVSMFNRMRAAEEDARVHNPTESAFESAVRGAVEQFAGSPFFKFDPDNAYDQTLRVAFDNMGTEVSIWSLGVTFDADSFG